MKKRNFSAIFILTLLIFTLPSCKNAKNTKETAADSEPQQTAEKVTVSQAAENVMKRKYKEAMYKFCYSHIFPNGEEAEYTGDFGEMSENNFAVYDVDSDGIKELIIKYEEVADVDAWEKEIYPNIEGKGNYPDNIDTENYGLVFLIRENGEEKILSKSQYDEWCISWFEDAEEYTIPYVSISPENIDAM